MLPGFGLKEIVRSQPAEECLSLCLAVLDNPDFRSRDEPPQTHEAVDRGIHRKEVGIDNRDRTLSNMGARSPTEKRRLGVTEIFLGEVRLSLKDWFYSHLA